MSTKRGFGKFREVYLANELRGIEKRSSPTQVDKSRAMSMKNMLLIDGANRKRNGWREIYYFRDENDKPLKINCISTYKDTLIVHAGIYLFRDGVIINKDKSISDEKSCIFENQGLLYIICNGEMLIYDEKELMSAYESKYAYIPTTSVSIMPVGYENISIKKEDISLLTSYRKNLLIGVKCESPIIRYRLDGRVDLEKGICVKTKMMTSLSSIEENVAPYNAMYNEATQVTRNNIEGVMGYADYNTIYDIFSGKGTDKDLSQAEEIAIFFKNPVKVEEARLSANPHCIVPRMSFYMRDELVYDTEVCSSGEELDISSYLYGQMIDTVYIYGNDGQGQINSIYINARHIYEGEIEICHRTDKAEYLKGISPTSITDIDGKSLSLSQNISGSRGQSLSVWLEKSLNNNEAYLCFSFLNPSPYKDECNIEATFSCLNTDKLKCQIGQVCSNEEGEGLLAVANDNCLYFSDNWNFNYFPKGRERKILTDGKITAICQGKNYEIEVFKKSDSYCILQNDEKREFGGYRSTGGAVCHHSTKSLYGDVLSLTENGVFGSGGFCRSSNILAMLRGKNIKDAVACVHNGRYYLFVGGTVFVADGKYKFYESTRTDSNFEYEWWVLDNCPASYVASINGKMLIGRNDGRIVEFYDGYSDIYYEKIDKGSFLLENKENATGFYLNDSLNIKDGDTLILNSSYTELCGIDACESENGYVRLIVSENYMGNILLYPNMTIYLTNENGEIKEARIVELDLYYNTITLDILDNGEVFTKILHKNQEEKYTLKANDDYFVLVDSYKREITLHHFDDIEISLERRKNVEAEYISSAILCNESYTRKSLYQLTIELSHDTEGLVEAGYETDASLHTRVYSLGRELNFDSFSFDTLSFNSSLKPAITIRSFERDFKYLIFKITHKENKPFGLNDYLIVYNQNGIRREL